MSEQPTTWPPAASPLHLPDPDPDALAEVEPDRLTPADETAAAHLVRAILKAEASLARLEAARQKDLEAWNQMIGAHKSRVQVWRMIVRDWMLRQDITKLQTPWFTASLAQPRTKIVVDDEDTAIRLTQELHAEFAVEIRKRLIKAKFDTLWNADPKRYKDCAHEEQGDVELRIRKREET